MSGERGLHKRPGERDPAIPLAVVARENSRAAFLPSNSLVRSFAQVGALHWQTVAFGMARGGSTPWWQAGIVPEASDEMTYECDAGLGSPAVVDCSQIQWQQLASRGATVTVAPGEAYFFLSSE